MAGNGTPPDESTAKLQWQCEEPGCNHARCDVMVLWSDSGHIEIRGEIRRNPIDGKLDWSVRVDNYGTSDMTMRQTAEMASKCARRMASQVGMVFRGPKLRETKTYELDD